VCLDSGSPDDAIDPDVAALMPTFFVLQPGANQHHRLSEETVMSVQRSWNKIMMGTARNYLYLKSTPGFIYTDSLDWFGQTFFVNLFEHYPSIIPLFTVHMSEMGRVLVIKMGEIVDLLTEPPRCTAAVTELAREQSLLGVHAVHYGMFAEIFLITLKNTLKEDYSDYAHTSWVKVRRLRCLQKFRIISKACFSFVLRIAGVLLYFIEDSSRCLDGRQETKASDHR
jgi:hemoglobin-like flavoprotein